MIIYMCSQEQHCCKLQRIALGSKENDQSSRSFHLYGFRLRPHNSRIVSSERGSWRWQDAYRIAIYAPTQLKDGRIVWQSQGRSCKYSWPQLKRLGYVGSLRVGSAHNMPLSADELAQIAQ